MTIYRLQGLEEQRLNIHYEFDIDSQPLGEGAMGRVFRGECVDNKTNTRTPVAIKAIYDNIPERVISRARREASVRIDNPHLLSMKGFIEVPFASLVNDRQVICTRYFVIMELLVGVTLYDMMCGTVTDYSGNVIPSVKALHDNFVADKIMTIRDIMTQVLRGVNALHEANYIHRDIDPSNIMITSDGTIKLIDFGICKPINALGTIDRNLTSTGVFMGKVNYASPELVIGDVTHQGPGTDIYALGILLFQLYTGHLPFSGDDNEVLLAHMRSPLPMKLIDNDSIKAIIKKSTQKSLSQRYGSADTMLFDVKQITVTSRHNIYLYISIVAALLLTFILCYSFSNSPDPTAHFAVSEEGYDRIQQRLWSNDATEAGTAFKKLAKIAKKESDPDIMFEYGLCYSVGNDSFDFIRKRQKLLNISPNIDYANYWFYRTLSFSPNNYRAIYWLMANLVEKKKKDASSVNISEIMELLNKFEIITQPLNDGVANKYKDASMLDRKQIQMWLMEQ